MRLCLGKWLGLCTGHDVKSACNFDGLTVVWLRLRRKVERVAAKRVVGDNPALPP